MRKATAILLILAATVSMTCAMTAAPRQQERRLNTAVVSTGELVCSVPVACTVEYAQQQYCLSLREGQISRVCVAAGQRVQKGQLLFVLDTDAEEQALAALARIRYQTRESIMKLGDEAQAVAQQGEWELIMKENELRQRIEASCVRSERDGIVEAVYVSPNMPVQAGTMLGLVRSEKKCVTGVVNASTITETLSAAVLSRNGNVLGKAKIDQITAPVQSAAGAQQKLTLVMDDDTALLDFSPGTAINAELVTKVYTDQALIPLEAIDDQQRVWVLENDKVYAVGISTERRNAHYAAQDAQQWAGKTIVLMPQSAELEGMQAQ